MVDDVVLDKAREREAGVPASAPPVVPGAEPDQEKTLVCPESDLHEVRHIGKYVVTRFLGHGAMGRVYLGLHPELQLQVAIKVIAERHVADPRYRRQFLQEARLASQINHPNVIRIYDADQDGDGCFMVQEYVDGGDVAALIRKTTPGGLAVCDALRIATGVAGGLAAAEKLQIVHRDVKPSNILLTREGEPKLADLGLARKIRHADSAVAEATLTQSGSTVGTPAYMAPEQILAAGQIDIRADIYSLGATLFEMVTGQPPFPGSSTEDILRRHLHDPVRDPRTLNPKLPRRVARLIMRMLAKRPEDRQPSATSLLRDLERVRQPYPKRSTLGWAAGLLLGVALLAGVLTQHGSGQDRGFADAMELTASGKYGQALPLVQAACQRQPHNQLFRYVLGLCHVSLGHREEAVAIRNELAASGAGAKLGILLGGLLKLQGGASSRPDPRLGTLEMICILAAAATAHAAERDDWTSTPAILVFQGIEGSGLAPAAQATAAAWLDGLEASLLQQATYPVVDRSALDFILRELLLSQTGMVTPEVRLRLGRLLPASVLVASSVTGPDGRDLNLRLVEVETSVVLGAFSRAALDGNPSQAALASLADELERCLAQREPAQGVISTVTDEKAEVNIGRCHGLVVGQELAVYLPQRSLFPRQVRRGEATARARVVALDRFCATVSLYAARAAVTPGMLVQVSVP